MSNIIEIHKLNYQNIFENLSLNIEKNSFVTISGPNNCGKTTLIRLLSGLNECSKHIYLNNVAYTSYKYEDLVQTVKSIIPGEIRFTENNLEEELFLHTKTTKKSELDFINFIVENLNLKKFISKDFKLLTKKELFLSHIALTLIERPQVVAIDNLDVYFDKKELDDLFNFFKEYKTKSNLTLILTTINLELSLYTDYLYIIHNNEIFLEGKPLEVLEKDNIINKIGLNLPFMVDLSVKLKDYDLVEDIETDMDRMVDILWK